MPRPEKVQAVAEIKERMESAAAVFLAEYAGLSVQDQQTLRRALRKGEAEFKVVKMTLARRAAADLDIDSLDELLLGPTGIAFADGDVVLAAKALRDFAKDHEVFTIKGGLLGDDFLTPERIEQLAEVESREVLLAKILGAMRAPMSNVAGLVAALPRGFATALQQLIDKAPAAPEPAAPADDAAADGAGEEPESATPEASAADDDGDDGAADEADSGDEESTDETETDDDPADEAEEE